MGRRSLVTERRQQIIAITIQVIATHGVRGTTLERVADTADMARGHIRHFVGNRDDLITDAARVFYFGDEAMDDKDLDHIAASAPILEPEGSLSEALDYLFGEFGEPGSKNAAAFSFHDASRSMPSVHAIVLRAYLGMQSSLSSILHREHPGAGEERCRRVAYTLVTMAIGNSYILDLEVSDERIADVRAIADQLIDSLQHAPASASSGTP